MNKDLQNDNSSHPAMHEVVGIKADLQKRDQRVVAASEDDQSDHVYDGEDSGSSAKFG